MAPAICEPTLSGHSFSKGAKAIITMKRGGGNLRHDINASGCRRIGAKAHFCNGTVLQFAQHVHAAGVLRALHAVADIALQTLVEGLC